MIDNNTQLHHISEQCLESIMSEGVICVSKLSKIISEINPSLDSYLQMLASLQFANGGISLELAYSRMAFSAYVSYTLALTRIDVLMEPSTN